DEVAAQAHRYFDFDAAHAPGGTEQRRTARDQAAGGQRRTSRFHCRALGADFPAADGPEPAHGFVLHCVRGGCVGRSHLRVRQGHGAVVRPNEMSRDGRGLKSGAAQPRSLASSVISGTAASALDSGQPFFAPCASSWNFALSMPGTVACSVSAMRSILKPSPSLTMRTAAVVSMAPGARPAFSQAKAKAMVKQAACA